MKTSSAQHTAVDTEPVSLRINLLALNLAIELARASAVGRTFKAPAEAMRELCELLDDDADQLGGGEGLRRAVEQLERVLRQAGEAAQRGPAPHGGTRTEAADAR